MLIIIEKKVESWDFFPETAPLTCSLLQQRHKYYGKSDVNISEIQAMHYTRGLL